jgi:hypothetical protein
VHPLFAPDSATADGPVRRQHRLLHFEQSSQYCGLPCGVEPSKSDAPAFRATSWHNSFFKAGLATDVRVLSFPP